MRINILADKEIELEQHPEIKITIGALTYQQFKQQKAIMNKYLSDYLARGNKIENFSIIGADKWFEFVCRHGIRAISGCEYEQGDKVIALELKRSESTYDSTITKESWGQLFPFLDGEIPVVADLISNLYQKKS